MRRICMAFALILATIARGATEPPRLRYIVQRLGNAEDVQVVAPGADGGGHAFLMRHRLGDWSRFNWPVFEPVATAEAVAFRARRQADQPVALAARVLTDDGVEWQSGRLEVAEEWREFRIEASGFAHFRGGTPAPGATADLAHVVQFQIVPMTSPGDGMGEFLIDEIRFLPHGPGWQAGDDELLPPADPMTVEWERVDDLLRRWDAERLRLDGESRRADRWLAELRSLAAGWADPAGRTAIQARMSAQAFAWQQAPESPPPQEACQGVDPETYRDLLRAGERPPVTLLAISPEMPLETSRLYAAVEQDPPEVVVVDGTPIARQRIRFTDAGQQTVFTVFPLPGVTDLEGQRLLLRMRCTAPALNAETPMLLRLYTTAIDMGESWGDLTPVPLPGEDWTDVVFDVANPTRAARFTPTHTTSLAVRLENMAGTGGAFLLEVASIRVAPPDAFSHARRTLLAKAEAAVAVARDGLYQRRDLVAREEDRLHETPELRQAYLGSFEAPRRRTGAAPEVPVEVLTGMSLPERPLRPQSVASRPILADGATALLVEASAAPAGSELLVELRDRAGVLRAAARGPASGVTLTLADSPSWAPGEPHVYSLRSVLREGQRVISSSERLVGLRTADLRVGGPDALLRHARQRRQPDWTYRLNGRCFYPRVAAYHWPDFENSVTAGVRLFGDLWMEGVRRYGFSLRQAEWDTFSRNGLTMFTSLAPGYRSLRSWADVPPWLDDYERQCLAAVAAGDSPLQMMAQVGNEVELTIWGSDLANAFPDALYQPLDVAAERLRRITRPSAPVMYVRAGSFRSVPPLPHEEVCGVNQYTGRYGGKIEEIDRNLAELARQALWSDRPVMITEWMGPKYSWASTGVGGVTRRGAGYYLERYWRAMIDIPGIIGSSEFTLNWVIAPFEDLTNQTREEAWKDRPPHDQFGGGRTADHVPRVGPAAAVRSEPSFRAMQAFHGPLYVMVNRPGSINILGAEAERIAEPLRRFRSDIVTAPAGAAADDLRGHVLRLLPPEPAGPVPHGWDEPVFRTELNPADRDGLRTTLVAASPEAAARGLDRLAQAAEALAELNRLEGAMTRALAVTDRQWREAYDNYLLEFAARGYLFCGDDVRLELDRDEFLDARGERRIAWQNLAAIIVDTERALGETEMDLLRSLAAQGATLIVSAAAYAPNPGLAALVPARLTPAGTLGDDLPIVSAIAGPVPVGNLGRADLGVIARFRPDLAAAPGLEVFTVEAADATALATTADGRPVIVERGYGQGRVVLVGVRLGAAIEVHRRVTRSGETHPIYDRDTACGLERLSRVIVNLCRLGGAAEQYRPRLYIEVVPEQTWVPAGEPARLNIRLTDIGGRPVAGQLRACVRTVTMGQRTGRSTPFADLTPTAPGAYTLLCVAAGAESAAATPETSVLTYAEARTADTLPRVLSVQIKAFAPGFIPADGATAVLLAPGKR